MGILNGFFVPPQVATANLAWASVAIHQVQVSQRHRRPPSSSALDTFYSVTLCNTLLKSWSETFLSCPGWHCLFWFCTGVFNGENPLCTGTGLSVDPVQSTKPYIQQTAPWRRHYDPVLFLYEQITPQRCLPTAAPATVDRWASASCETRQV